MDSGRSERISEGFGGIVLAAGRGSRMGASVPKVMLEVLGIPMVSRVVASLREAGVAPICVVVSGPDSPVRDLLGGLVRYAVQEHPTGTGDAVAAAREAVRECPDVLVACGDSPLFLSGTVRRLMDVHRESDAVLTLVTARLENPSGYGRIVRDASARIARIVEETAASPEEKRIQEVNGGLYAFNARWLWQNLKRPSDTSREYVLTEVVARAVEQHRTVSSTSCGAEELAGVNTPAQLEAASRIVLQRQRATESGKK